jgi:repressor LexA
MAPTGAPLSEQQAAVLEALVAFYHREGCSPTIRELGDECGIASTGHVSYYLGVLARAGYIRRDYHVARGIQLLAPALTGAHPSVEWAT